MFMFLSTRKAVPPVFVQCCIFSSCVGLEAVPILNYFFSATAGMFYCVNNKTTPR